MRVLFSTIGSRGDVQPLVALASHMKALGHEVRVCVPPDFREWIERLGISVIPMGPEVRRFAASRPAVTQPQKTLTREQRRQIWRNRMEWMAFGACLCGGAALILLFALASP